LARPHPGRKKPPAWHAGGDEQKTFIINITRGAGGHKPPTGGKGPGDPLFGEVDRGAGGKTPAGPRLRKGGSWFE